MNKKGIGPSDEFKDNRGLIDELPVGEELKTGGHHKEEQADEPAGEVRDFAVGDHNYLINADNVLFDVVDWTRVGVYNHETGEISV